jgi:hypothetical protein
MKRLAPAILLAAAAACAAAQPPAVTESTAAPEPRARKPRVERERPKPGARELEVAVAFLPGTYESIDQEKGPGAGTRMRIAPMWPELAPKGEHWFYVEHARVDDDAKPFRQRLYRFTHEGLKFFADVFELPGEPKRFVGEWKKQKPFAEYSPKDVREYEGCRLAIGHMLSMWWARTEGKACRAETPGAAHEASEMLVSTAGMKNGEQAYGPEGRLIAGHPGVWDFRRVGPVRPASP